MIASRDRVIKASFVIVQDILRQLSHCLTFSYKDSMQKNLFQ